MMSVITANICGNYRRKKPAKFRPRISCESRCGTACQSRMLIDGICISVFPKHVPVRRGEEAQAKFFLDGSSQRCHRALTTRDPIEKLQCQLSAAVCRVCGLWFIFAPFGHYDESEFLPCENPQIFLVKTRRFSPKALTSDRFCGS